MSENKFTPRAEEVLRLSQEAAEEPPKNGSSIRKGRSNQSSSNQLLMRPDMEPA